MSSQTQPIQFEGLSEEIRHFWRRLPDKTLFFVLLAGWMALFHFFGNSSFGYIPSASLFKFMAVSYNADSVVADDGHGNFIPLVVLIILWLRRDEIFSHEFRMWWPSLLLIAAGLLAHIVGFIVQQQRLSIIGLFFGLYGLTGLIWGPKWLKATFFPFFLFAFMVPLGSLTEKVTFPLRLLVTWIVEHLFGTVLGVGVIRNGTMLFNGLGTYQYDIAPACGGMRSLISIFLISVSYAFLVFKSPLNRLAMVCASLPLAVIGNVVRLSTIVAAGELKGQAAGNFVHDNGIISMLPYIPAIIGVMWIGQYLERREKAAKTTVNADIEAKPA
jgi:exosortase